MVFVKGQAVLDEGLLTEDDLFFYVKGGQLDPFDDNLDPLNWNLIQQYYQSAQQLYKQKKDSYSLTTNPYTGKTSKQKKATLKTAPGAPFVPWCNLLNSLKNEIIPTVQPQQMDALHGEWEEKMKRPYLITAKFDLEQIDRLKSGQLDDRQPKNQQSCIAETIDFISSHPCRSKMLIAALKVWDHMFSDVNATDGGKIIKPRIVRWLKKEYPDISDTTAKEISKVVNPDIRKGGGAPSQ